MLATFSWALQALQMPPVTDATTVWHLTPRDARSFPAERRLLFTHVTDEETEAQRRTFPRAACSLAATRQVCGCSFPLRAQASEGCEPLGRGPRCHPPSVSPSLGVSSQSVPTFHFLGPPRPHGLSVLFLGSS